MKVPKASCEAPTALKSTVSCVMLLCVVLPCPRAPELKTPACVVAWCCQFCEGMVSAMVWGSLETVTGGTKRALGLEDGDKRPRGPVVVIADHNRRLLAELLKKEVTARWAGGAGSGGKGGIMVG
jgi:hypothetical protein